jgi:transposase
LQVVRDWVLKFNGHGPDGLIDRKAPGQAPRLNVEQRAALAAILESGPIPAVCGVVRRRIVDLRQWIFEEFRVVVSQQMLSGVLRKMGYRKLSARPRHHAQVEGAIEDFKNVWPAPSATDYVEVAADQSASTYSASEVSPGQDGDTRAPVLIKLTASSAIYGMARPSFRRRRLAGVS